jgi:hypothetical protein
MPTATLQSLIDQMGRDHNAMNGWDVVLNMLIDPVDQLFTLMYDDRTPGSWQTIEVAYCQVLPNPVGGGDIVAYTALDATLAQPELTFVAGDENVARISFAAAGSLRQAAAPAPAGFDPAKDCDPSDPSLKWSTRQLSSQAFVATVPLTVVQGSANAIQTVLAFPSGSFQWPGLADPPEPTRLTSELRGYFAAHGVTYVVNEVQTDVAGQVAALQPTSFRINTLRTNAGKSILQLFITTIGTPPSNLTVDVNEPIPDGTQCNVMVRKAIVDQLGTSLSGQLSTFAREAVVFPTDRALTLTEQYQPYDLLVLGSFDLGDRLTIVSGDGQQVARSGDDPLGGTARFGPLKVQATDVLGKVHAGATVVFSRGAYPPQMAVQLAPGGQTVSVATDADGIATLDAMSGSSVVCYYDQGPLEIVATAAGGDTAVLHLTVAATPPPPVYTDATVSVVSGDGQHVARTGHELPGGSALFGALVVVVRGADGIALPAARVSWAAGTHPDGMAVQLDPSGADHTITTAGADGRATLAEMDGGGVQCYYAEGPFTVVASVPGGKSSATFSLTVAPTPPPPVVRGANVSVVSGNGQRVALSGTAISGGIANFAALRVLVKDPQGQPLPDVQVDWTAAGQPSSMAVQLNPAGASSQVTTTAADGTSTLAEMSGSSVSCYYASGPFRIVASCVGGQTSATFDLTVDPAAPPTPVPGAIVTIVFGDGQQVARSGDDVPGGMAMFAAMKVAVRDAQGNPLRGAAVEWSTSSPRNMAAQLDPLGASSVIVATDSDGMSLLEKMPGDRSVYCYYASGPFTVTASVPGGGSATFHETVTG